MSTEVILTDGVTIGLKVIETVSETAVHPYSFVTFTKYSPVTFTSILCVFNPLFQLYKVPGPEISFNVSP